jgi:putative glycerol-1-phosphate prenyltransferase
MILQSIQTALQTQKKQLGVLIDPDKFNLGLVSLFKTEKPDFILVGGSLLSKNIDSVISEIKTQTDLPVVIFPGNAMQISAKADAILFLSLISGRNPEFLIGNHVQAAPLLQQTDLEVIPTSYILVENGKTTAVEYMSNTRPIPADKTEILLATALAGQYLGHRLLYLEAGSGAQAVVTKTIIGEVKANLDIPIMVGGGIQTTEQLKAVYSAGADVAVLGTILENNATLLSDFLQVRNQFND